MYSIVVDERDKYLQISLLPCYTYEQTIRESVGNKAISKSSLAIKDINSRLSRLSRSSLVTRLTELFMLPML